MAIVNNPHNIQDIDKQYTTWTKLAKQKGILISGFGGWLLSSSAYHANEWLASVSEGTLFDDPIGGKVYEVKAKMVNNIKTNYFTNVDFTNMGRFTEVFLKNDDKEYFFQFHFYTIDELIQPYNSDKGLLYNNGLFELRILDGNSPSANVVDTVKVCCNDNSSGFRNNDASNEVLPEKFMICYINSDKSIGIVESDRIYHLDGLYFFAGYGMTGNFINVASNSATLSTTENNTGIPRFYSLINDLEMDNSVTQNTFTSTSLVKVPKATNNTDAASASYFFNDSTKQRNGLNVDPNNTVDLVRNIWFTADEYPELREFNLFTKFRLNTEFMINIYGPFYKNNNINKTVTNKIETIDMDTFRMDNCKRITGLFAGLKKLKTIKNFAFMKANKVESMTRMFDECDSLESITLTGVVPNCKNYSRLFQISSNSYKPNTTLKTITMQALFRDNISKVENFEYAFYNNSALTTIGNLSLNMPKCKSFERAFMNCKKLQDVDLSDINSDPNTSVNLAYMFYDCNNITGPVDLSKISRIGDMKNTFYSASKLTSIKFKKGALDFRTNPPINSRGGVIEDNLTAAFNNCSKLTKIENIEDLDVPNAITVSELFSGMESIESLSLPKFTFENVIDASLCFAYQRKVKSISVPKAVFGPKTGDISRLFNFNTELKTLDFPPLTKPNNPQNTTNLTRMVCVFYNCSKLETPIYISNINTSKVNTMYGLFRFGNTLASDNPVEIHGIEDMNVSKVNDFTEMFGVKLKDKTTLDLSRWDVSKGVTFTNMFSSSRINKFNLTGWNMTNAMVMDYMFSATMITSTDDIIGLDGLNLTNVRNKVAYDGRNGGGINGLFNTNTYLTRLAPPNSIKNIPNIVSLRDFVSGCNNLTSLDLNGANYGVISDIDRIANDCRSLETIDFTGITFKIKYAQYAFMDCRVLREIKGAVFDFADLEDINNIQDMFKYCNSLNGVKVKNIPNNNKTRFEQVTGLSSSQYTVVS